MNDCGLALPELLETARLLALRVRREVDGGLGGAYASRRRGSGLEFEELREFADGDDARTIHWPATLSQGRGRLSNATVKSTNRTCLSVSMSQDP